MQTNGAFSALPRTANHWWEASGVEARSLLKLYGIRFDILVTGKVKFRPEEGLWKLRGTAPAPETQPGSLRQGSLHSFQRPSQWALEQLGWAW